MQKEAYNAYGHLYEILEKAKELYAGKNQDCGCTIKL